MAAVVYQSLTREEIAYLVAVHVWEDTVVSMPGLLGNPAWWHMTDRRTGIRRGPGPETLADKVLADYGMGRTISEMWRHGFVPSISLDAGRNNVDRFLFHNYTAGTEFGFRITLNGGGQPRLARACQVAALYAIDPGAPP